MNKERKKLPKSVIKLNSKNNKKVNEYFNNTLENFLPTIDILLNKMKNMQIKSISMKIFYMFKDNNYEDIQFDIISSRLIKEYASNPSNILNSNNNQFNSQEKLIASLNLSKKNDSFNFFNKNGISYIRINPPKALEILTNLYNKHLKDDSTNISEEEKKYKLKKRGVSLIGKKRKRGRKRNKKVHYHYQEDKRKGKKLVKRNNSKKIEEIKESEEKINLNISISNKEDENISGYDEGMKNLKKISSNNNLIFFQGSPLKKNLSSLTFCDIGSENLKILSSNINETFNINNLNSIKMQNEGSTEILYQSKNEEIMYGLLKKEIGPITKKISEINTILNEKKGKLDSIDNHLKMMDDSLNNYKEIKTKFKKDSNTLEELFKIIDIEAKILTLFQNVDGFLPFKNEEFKKHIEYFKKCLNESKMFIDNNKKKINLLNDFDIQFNYHKVTIQNEAKEIFGYNYDFLSVEKAKSLIKPELTQYFIKLQKRNNNDSLNDFKLLYNENSRYLEVYENYNVKLILFEKKSSIMK